MQDSSRPTGPGRRALSGAVVSALLLAGVVSVATETATAPPAAAQAEGSVNPFSSTGGFTVYSRQDTTLGNDELEGSLAVGGTLTVTEAPTYAILHVVAGTGDYTVPTVDGDPTRLLAGRYDDSSANVGSINITNAGRDQNPPPGSPESRGTLKLVDRTIDPFVTSARGSNWVRMSMPGSNPPLIDATAQSYPADAAPPDGSNVSIFTQATGTDTAQVVADYVRANEDALIEDAAQCLATVTDPSAQNAWHVEIAEDVGDRIVLGPLASDRPNVLAYEDIAGAGLLQFSTPVRPGVENPLIIKVPEGTTNVQGLRIDPAGEYAPYTMWDLSAVTGAVTVANTGGRIDGSVYAPFADVTVDAAPLESQVLGNNVHLLGGEVHSYLFASNVTCGEEGERGTFQVSKDLLGITADELPEGTTFPLDWTAELPDGSVETGTIQVPADGTAQGPIALDRTWATFPVGTTVTFSEPEPGSVPGWDWTGSAVAPNPVTITAEDPVIDVTLTNTAERQAGTFEVTKTVSDGSEAPPALPAGTTITVAWTADRPDGDGPDSGTLELVAGADGSFAATGPVDSEGEPVQFPVGTQITLSEPELPAPPDGYTWDGPAWTPGATFTIERADQLVSVDLLNLLVPEPAETAFSVVKVLDAEGTDIPTFTLEYTVDPAGDDPRTIGQAEFGVDAPVRITTTPDGDPIPADATVWVREAELPPGGQVWEDPELTVDGEPLAGPDEDGFYELPLVGGETLALTVSNVGRVPTGSFTVQKVLQGVDPEAVPEDLRFTVNWTATYPDGSTVSGSTEMTAGGDPVPPTDPDGEPLTFPQGTTVTFTEPELPEVPGWQWEEPTIEPDTLTIVGDQTGAVNVTNTATLIDGTFEVSKALTGIDADQLLTDNFTVDWTATLPDDSTATGTIQVPADGTAAGPDRQFPVGTMIVLSEPDLAAGMLPPLYQWAGATWSPGASLVVEEDTGTAQFTVTNTAVPGTSVSVEKIVDGDASVPADVQFPIEYSVVGHVPVTEAEIGPGEPLVIDRVAVGSVIRIRELAPPEVPGVVWDEPVWTLDGEVLEPHADGWVVLQADSTEPVQLTLTNTATAVPEGTFTVAKSFDGIDPGDLPADTTFSVDWTAQLPDGTSSTGTIDVPADGEPVGPSNADGPVTFPAGTEITYTERLPEVDGISWDAASFAPDAVTIADDGSAIAVALTNTGHPTTPQTPGEPGDPGAPGAPGAPDGPGLPSTGFAGSALLLAAVGLTLLGLLVRTFRPRGRG